MEIKGELWHAEHRAFQDGYAAGFIKALRLVREAMDLKRGLDHETIKGEFEEYKKQEKDSGEKQP